MSESRATDRRAVYRFGEFELSLRPLRLKQGSESIPLQPQPSRLLALLLERSGEILDRDEIRDAIWGDQAHLDHQQAINYAIRKIRVALGDQAGKSRYVETVPREGYRMIVPVEKVQTQAEPARERPGGPRVPVADPTLGEEPAARRRRSTPRRVLRGLVASVALLTLAVLVAVGMTNRLEPADPVPPETAAESPAGPPAQRPEWLAPDLYTLYLQGRYLISRWNGERVELGLQKLEEVIRVEPTFAPARAALALGTVRLGARERRPFSAFMPQAREHGLAAIQLDPDQAEAHWLVALVDFYYRHDWSSAEASARRAVRLQPRAADFLQLLGVIQSSMGRHEEAVELVRQARELDPASTYVSSDLAFCLMFARRLPEALEVARSNLEVSPGEPMNTLLVASIELLLGRRDEALEALSSRLVSIGLPSPSSLEVAFDERIAHLENNLRQGKPSSFTLALTHALAGDEDTSLSYLLEACDHDPDWELPFVAVDPRFDAIRRLEGYARLAPCLPPGRPAD